MKPRASAVARILRPTWFEIDLVAIAHNLRQLRRMLRRRSAYTTSRAAASNG